MALTSIKKSKSIDLETLASNALAALNRISSGLPLDDVSPEDAMAARAGNRVSAEVMTIAATVLEANPKRFTDYDPRTIREAVKYEQAMTPLATQVTLLGEQITKSVLKRRGDAAVMTLSLYQTLKGISRLSKTEATRAEQRRMAKLLTTNHKRRATSVTQVEASVAVKGVKKKKVAADKAALAAAAAAVSTEAAIAAGDTPPVLPAASPVLMTAPPAVVATH